MTKTVTTVSYGIDAAATCANFNKIIWNCDEILQFEAVKTFQSFNCLQVMKLQPYEVCPFTVTDE